MKKAPSKHKRTSSLVDCAPKTLLPLFAVGSSLVAGPAAAIELGEATVQSQLGQPLRASIAFALAPREKLAESCISLGLGQSGLPGIGRASISIGEGALLLRGSTPIREPLVATNVVISCPFAAHLAREYMMFIDPVGATVAEPPVAAQPTVVRPTVVQPTFAVPPPAISATQAASAVPTRRRTSTVSPRVVPKINRDPIGAATRYRVQPGDSLSEITQRIENRPPGLWAAVNILFEANPDAFIDNDPNKLKAGSWLTIPSFDGSAPVLAKAATTTVNPIVDVAPATNVAEVAETASPAVVSQPVRPEAAQPPVTVVDTTTDLQPAELNANSGSASTVVEVAANESIDIPDTALVGPETPSASPNVTTAAVQERATQATSSWMLWLAGSGVAIVLALLLFGRNMRSRFNTGSRVLESELPMREASPEPDALELRDDVDYHLDDDSETIECATLDADLLMGTGLHQTIEVDPAKDVGFPSPTEVDIELPFAAELELAPGDDNVRSASLSADATILDSEILPDSDDYPDPEDFDMSVVLDATKMPQPEDVSESALEAIAMDSQTDTQATIVVDNDFTAGSTVDLTILEQDYEDELCATQALDMDVTQAALMLGEMEAEQDAAASDDASSDDDPTAAMSLAEVTDFDVKTHLEADNDEMITLNEDLGFGDELTIHLADDEETVEMVAREDDETREMPARGAKMKKKAG